jgi:thiol-disulfide isomerase/thioredoxin
MVYVSLLTVPPIALGAWSMALVLWQPPEYYYYYYKFLLLMQCGPCRAFTPQLLKTYQEVKDAGKKFEIIFCSSDREEDAYKEYYATMPWLALPFGDNRKKSLSRVFDVTGKQ